MSKNKGYDVTECVICADTYTDPRQLPCLHTFCRTCIESCSQDKQPGDALACPLCRREFTFSESGLGGLPKDRFIGKMLMVRRLTSQVASHMQCDECQRGGSADPSAAQRYCVDCCDSFCKPCAAVHRESSSSAGHELVKLRKRRPSRPEKLFSKLTMAPCYRHPRELRDMYCVDCSVTTCRRCLADEHKSHKAGDVDWLGDRLRQGIDADVVRMQHSVTRCSAERDRLRRTRDEFDSR